jgi:cystathionine gamma-synthase
VVRFATKYLNGHSDVVAGVVGTARKDAVWARIMDVRQRLGAFLGPFDAFLLLRGLQTLDVRVRAQCQTAALLAERLRVHPAIKAVLYPGLPDHPGHAIAAPQMSGCFGGMLSIRPGDRGGGSRVAMAAGDIVRRR